MPTEPPMPELAISDLRCSLEPRNDRFHL
jgi:hypothetical protein